MERHSARRPFGAAFPMADVPSGSSSFTDFLRVAAPRLLPNGRPTPHGVAAEQAGLPHGTTIVALTFRGGVVIAGDRRATSGSMISQRDVKKVYITDDYSAIGISGTVGIAVELARLFAVELQHYEKIEGVPLTLDGKAKRLATMVKSNLDNAMNGLIALPLFVGYDLDAAEADRGGRIISYDPVGGFYDETPTGYEAVGSGSVFAKTALKKLYDRDADRDAAVRAAVESLFDAADEDTGTGGPDLFRKIYPMVVTITAEGAEPIPDEDVASVVEAVVAARHERPGG
ncbi:proteasome subunit beta [Goodfellowiella coeruleoviolacea]|uniref:Proteasome subunit beta n=1 Tax=Goodfellowiella coeruleoviolacea TaxID=334858 RepID=A0AAE3G8N1_9PSEU|nr:proteasome subunit beta [Goodfellowiella coeruleoviolacea]MCP2163697.1 proteasome endopeptidase complex, beta component (EC 3.4.25.1), Threonine peptidase, MEROPS family T01B [Goodfellowiella coeruleoviolacea]